MSENATQLRFRTEPHQFKAEASTRFRFHVGKRNAVAFSDGASKS